MRPTIPEQLSGADRLLALAETEETVEAAAELIGNARRLIKGTSLAWDQTLPFLRTDAAELTDLLGDAHVAAPTSTHLPAIIEHHERLVAALSQEILAWDHDDKAPLRARQAQIGAYLLRRVGANPN